MSSPSRNLRATVAAATVAVAGLAALHARADLPPWLQSVVSASAIESALFRAMALPGLSALYPRPPAEARTELTSLVNAKPVDAQLYALRAQVAEQALDFPAAEADWKASVVLTPDKAAANLQLADFYHRRNQGPREIAALEASAIPPTADTARFLPADQQPAWLAFNRALTVAHDQALPDDDVLAVHRARIARYPGEPAARANLIAALLNLHRFDETQHAIDDYRAAFPQDNIVPIKAAALLALAQKTPESTSRALALFDTNFQPLWPHDLIQTWFDLLAASHTQHAFLTSARAALQQNPDNLAAATKIFYFYQQTGHQDTALNSLALYGASKSARNAASPNSAPWSPDELYTFATLLERANQPDQAARYDFALATTPGRLTAATASPEEAALTAIVRILLASPDQAISLGSGNLSLYRDLATIDNGPGHLNGILSLWLNSETPDTEFASEEQKATPYFHRAKAAELLTVLDQRFPQSTARPTLHAGLIRAYVAYGQDAAVRQAAQRFLADFPRSPATLDLRLEVALELADADQRLNDTRAEFALYNSLLTDLAANLQGLPLTAAGPAPTPAPTARPDDSADTAPDNTDNTDRADDTTAPTPSTPAAKPIDVLQQSLTLPILAPPTAANAAAYRQILDRYLGRLTQTNQLPAALAVLRRELDRNPNDPLLYERLADFLQQNKLSAQEEQVYQRALTRFPTSGFYDKLARLYLRQKRRADFATLTRKVVDIFEGSDLEAYFANVHAGSVRDTVAAQQYLQLNLYAHQRFPHDLAFTQNLLSAYSNRATLDTPAWEHLLREHWTESPLLQSQFFAYLSRTHKLAAELTSLEALSPSTATPSDFAATRELAQIHLWQSHFELGAPLLGQLADAYPADPVLGDQAASIFRSLAYNDPTQITRAVAIQQHLAAADPTSLDRLATIGDIYADSTNTSLNLDTTRQLAQAAPFFRRIAAVHPGLPDGYLQSATVFWDYFQFDQAIAQLNAARQRFHDPALYGYQAGAIYENKRDYPRAVAEYVTAAIAETPTSVVATTPTATSSAGDATDAESESDTDTTAMARLLTLATRSATADLVDKATAAAVNQHPTFAALELRFEILDTLHRKTDIAPIVDAAISSAANRNNPDPDDLGSLATFAQTHNLPRSYQTALQREIALATDPIQKIQLQYQLSRSLEDQHDTPSAQRIIAAIYTENPRLVGVVRSTVDFYWRTKQPKPAIATLLQASAAANASLAHDFTLEAITKSNQSADYTGARALLKPLRTADPFNETYLSLEADSYALAHDSTGLRDLYTSTLAALNAAPLPAPVKRDKIALARQGLIPALTELKDFRSALDQHISLISAFPEDPNILQAAAAYARLHTVEPQLVGFLNKTVADSPRDSRFAIDLARVDLQFEDYDGALAAYSKAIAIRRDRPDLFIARADIEEHQQAFDAACADYDRLYLLTYKDPQWMEKSALARARQGKPELAVKALQAAYIDDRLPTPSSYFTVASQLEQWNLLAQAQSFADQGVKLAGDTLLSDPKTTSGAILATRLLARQRRAPEALALLQRQLAAVGTSPSAPAVIVQQVEQNGIAAVTDAEWRANLVRQRQTTAHNTYLSALTQLGSVVSEFYTPEEKSAFATLLDTQRANRPPAEVADLWIPAAHAAGLLDREAAWRRDLLLHAASDPASQALAAAQLAPFDTLEAARMDNKNRAETLDAYAKTLKPVEQPAVLTMAAHAWRDAGDSAAEVLDLRLLVETHHQLQEQQRLFELLLANGPAQLLQLAARNNDEADAPANYLLAHTTPAVAYQAVAARATHRDPIWATATTALTGLYFNDTSPRIDTAFETALGDRSIGDRLAAKAAPAQQLFGKPWFFYGGRYGVFLSVAPTPAHDPEDFLASELESLPSDPATYTALAQLYLDANKIDAAIAEYNHVLELDPTDPTPNLAIARALWADSRRSGNQAQALAAYQAALTQVRALVDVRAVPETFWTTIAAIGQDASDHNLGASFKPALDAILTAYIRKNANYRTIELLHSAFISLERQNPTEATTWILALANKTTPDSESSLLASLAAEPWLPRAQLDPVYRRHIAVVEAQLTSATTPPDEYAKAALNELKAHYIHWLLRNNRAAEAQAVFDAIPVAGRTTPQLQTLTILLAARQSRLPALLTNLATADSATAISLDTLAAVANTLRLQHDNPNSRLLLEYVFLQKLQTQSLTAPDYLALAEARLATADLPGALDLLHRLTLQGDLYENLDSASGLLVRTGHPAEALPMLLKLSNGTPWSAPLRLRLAQTQLALKHSPEAATLLSAVASADTTPYPLRAQSAEALRPLPGAKSFSSNELTLLASTTPTPAQVDRPYCVFARLAAAAAAPAAQRPAILLPAIAIAPDATLDLLRLQLFRAEMAQTHYPQASVAIALVLDHNPTLRSPAPTPADGTSDDDTQQTTIADSSTLPAEAADSTYSVASALAPAPARLTFLLGLATMDEHLQNDSLAIQDLQTASQLDPAQKPKLDARVLALQARLALDAENAARRPQIHPSVEQTALVRPRLPAAVNSQGNASADSPANSQVKP